MEEDREILCLPAGTGYYGIEFPYVVELCQEFRISPVPCLQEPYCGVANYKGMIIPVAQLQEGEWAERENRTDGCVLAVVRFGKFWLGLLSCREPFIISLSESVKIQNDMADRSGEIWQEKALYENEGRLCAVLDLEKTMEGLVLHP